MTTTLTAQTLTLGYGTEAIVDALSLTLLPGKVTMIVGANASGKSTLLRGLARLLAPRSGAVLLDGQDLHRMPSRQVARKLGILPQTPVAPEGITVAELVGRGRTPHQALFRHWGSADDAAVMAALEATGTLDLVERSVDELSGGQRQRVWIAMALAQETELLLLDEPTTYLDLAHQIEVLELLSQLNRQRGTTIAVVLHDLNLAARYGDHLVALRNGRVHAEGKPAAVLDAELVRDVFNLESIVVDDPVSGTPLVVPLGRFPAPPDRGSKLPSTDRVDRAQEYAA